MATDITPDWIIKQSDTAPSIEFQLVQSCDLGDTGAFQLTLPSGTVIWVKPVDLSTADYVTFAIKGIETETFVHSDPDDQPVDIFDATDGWCRYGFADSDLETPDMYRGEAKSYWSDGTHSTFPNGDVIEEDSYYHLLVRADLRPTV